MKPPLFDASWSAEVQAVYRHDMEEMWDRRLAPSVWNQYHNQLDLYLSAAGDEPLDVLDVGCAQATLAILLAERGHRVCAVDLRASFLDYARSRYTHGVLELVCANAFELSLGRQFDLVFANQILEHVVYPERVLSRLVDHLRPGGRLVVTTPNGDYLVNGLPTFQALGDRALLVDRQNTADADGHFFAYRAEELLQLVRDQGLVDLRRQFFETPWISGHMRVRHLHRALPSAVLRGLDRVALAIPGVGRRLAHQLMVSARKPDRCS